jgi:TonB family protein
MVSTDTAAGTMATTDTSAKGTMSASTITPSTTSAANTVGTAKPNPAKKGLKGKAVITVPAKGTGAMEMDKEGIYSNVEYLPSFPGGAKGLQKFFDNNLQYPTAATDDGIEGTVNVSFIVDENGKLSSPQVQGQAPGFGLEAEALRVIQKMPSWTPGKLKGKNVKTRFTLPVRFQLD